MRVGWKINRKKPTTKGGKLAKMFQGAAYTGWSVKKGNYYIEIKVRNQ